MKDSQENIRTSRIPNRNVTNCLHTFVYTRTIVSLCVLNTKRTDINNTKTMSIYSTQENLSTSKVLKLINFYRLTIHRIYYFPLSSVFHVDTNSNTFGYHEFFSKRKKLALTILLLSYEEAADIKVF